MKPGQNPNKQRSRGRNNNNNNNNNGKRHIPSRNQTFDSSGPDIRIRGNAHQVLEKYLSLARDAAAQGDRISAENFYQHAEHYFRVINAQNTGRPQMPRPMGTPADDHAMLAGDLEEEEGDAFEAGEDEAEEAEEQSQPEPIEAVGA